MRKVIAAINMTIDGVGDHTALEPDEEVHHHYSELLAAGDVILYGRKTYQLMQFWQTLLEKPSGEKSMDEFALAIDKIEKIVFSRTLQHTGWPSAALAEKPLEETVKELKQQAGKNIFVGSRSLILELLKLNLIDELQLCILPLIAGKGMLLFENMDDRILLQHERTKNFTGGAVLLYYAPAEKK